MPKFKVGDYVKVIGNTSGSKYFGRSGYIKEIKSFHNGYNEKYYCLLDIDIKEGGIWETELELISYKEVKVYGIVFFMETIYK